MPGMLSGTALVVVGVFVLLNWLLVAFIDRIQNWRTPWDRWARVRPDMNWIMKLMLIGFASYVSLLYAVMLFLAIAG